MRLPTTYGLDDRVCNTYTCQRSGAASTKAVPLVQHRIGHMGSNQRIAQGVCKCLPSQRSAVLHRKQRRIKSDAVSTLDSGTHVFSHCDYRTCVTAISKNEDVNWLF